MQSLRSGNLLLALLIEIVAIVGFGVAGWSATHVLWLRVLLTAGLAGVAIAAWAVWAAPRSGSRLKPRPLVIFKIVVFALATAAWWFADQSFVAAVFGILAAINLLGAWAFGQI
jgi:hypothetical protein